MKISGFGRRSCRSGCTRNLDAHAFIPASFWTAHFEMVRDMLPQAELYVHEDRETPGKSTASSV
ncbi:MAG: hypothetical protein ACLU3I_09610 [Acutalibacteraceae bacterium]